MDTLARKPAHTVTALGAVLWPVWAYPTLVGMPISAVAEGLLRVFGACPPFQAGSHPAATAYGAGTRRPSASSASVSTVERGYVGPVFISSTVTRFRHFATVFGLMPSSRLSCASEACDHSGQPSNQWRADPHYCCSDGVRGRGAPVTNLSHSASFHSCERIAPSNRGIKHLAMFDHFADATTGL